MFRRPLLALSAHTVSGGARRALASAASGSSSSGAAAANTTSTNYARVPIRGFREPLNAKKGAATALGCLAAGAMLVKWNEETCAAAANKSCYSEPLNPKEFSKLCIEEKEDLTKNTFRIRFKLDKPENTADVPGNASFMLFRMPKKDDAAAESIIRPYTPVSYNAKGSVDFVIKRYDNGAMTPSLSELKKGDCVEVKGPLKKFDLTSESLDNVALISGGTGITPMIQVARKILNNDISPSKDASKVKITLLYGSISEDDVLLKDELDALVAENKDRMRVVYLVDKAKDSKKWSAAGGLEGYVTRDLLKRVLPSPTESGKVKLFVCGPPGLVNAVCGPKAPDFSQGDLKGYLKDLGYTADQVFKF